MRTMRFTLAVAFASALCTLPIALAQSENSLPKEQHAGAVAWISGGIGKAQADAMRGVAPGYNLRLVFAEQQKTYAAFLGDVAVKISDAKGSTVLRIRTGPLLFLKLPAGRYSVSAEVAGQTIVKSVRVRDKVSKEITLIWPETVG
jgi:hypothetical protein